MSLQFLGPQKTPTLIKYLIIIVLATSLLSTPISYVLHRFFDIYGPNELLPLSIWGIKKGFVWQFVTYLFLQATGASFFAFIALLFNLLILWVVGSLLNEEFGSKRFLTLFFGSSVFAALAALIVMSLIPYHYLLAGTGPAIYALLFTVSMLFPDLEAALFFIVKIKIKWVIFIFIGISLLSSLFSSDWVLFTSECAAILFAYFYGVIVLRFKSPFLFTHSFDRFLHRNTFWLFSFFTQKRKSKKIVSLKDEKFMDEMLEKISKEGPKSLSPFEKRRMKKISKRRKS